MNVDELNSLSVKPGVCFEETWNWILFSMRNELGRGCPYHLNFCSKGIAKTGSGKTAVFVLPMIVHIMAQSQLNEGEGPIGVIVAPTRGLAEQIHKQARVFGKPYGEQLFELPSRCTE